MKSAATGLLVWLSAAGTLTGLSATGAQAQYPTPTPSDPRHRRAEMERAVANYGGGEAVRRFIEDHGTAGVKAINACSPAVGKRLAQWHSEPDGLNKLPRPSDFLLVVADKQNGGDDVVLFAIAHARELQDIDSFEAYLRDPLEYALSLKQLSQGAAENRARRLEKTGEGQWWVDAATRRGMVAAGLALLGVLVFWVLKKKKESSAPPMFPPRSRE